MIVGNSSREEKEWYCPSEWPRARRRLRVISLLRGGGVISLLRGGGFISWEVEEWSPERWRRWRANMWVMTRILSSNLTRHHTREQVKRKLIREISYSTDLYFSMGQLTGMCVLAEFLNTNFSHKLGRKRTFYKTEKNNKILSPSACVEKPYKKTLWCLSRLGSQVTFLLLTYSRAEYKLI